MSNRTLSSIDNKSDYLTVLEAVTGKKTGFSQEEASKLLEIYLDKSGNKFGFSNKSLVKAMLELDVPGVNLLDKADADALSALCELYRDWEPDAEKTRAVKDAALNGDVSRSLDLALARAALDACAGQRDIAPYREDIAALAGVLTDAGDEEFSEASVFLIRVRERVR